MNIEFLVYNPAMTERYNSYIGRQNLDFDKAYSKESGSKVIQIIHAAEAVSKSLKSSPDNHGKSSFLLVITKKGNLPVKNLVIGDANEIHDFEDSLVKVNVNANVLKANPNAKFSSEIFCRSTETGDRRGIGALSVGEWIVSVYGFENTKMNAATLLGISFGSKLISYDEAEALAHDPRINCVSEYMTHEDLLTAPFLH